MFNEKTNEERYDKGYFDLLDYMLNTYKDYKKALNDCLTYRSALNNYKTAISICDSEHNKNNKNCSCSCDNKKINNTTENSIGIVPVQFSNSNKTYFYRYNPETQKPIKNDIVSVPTPNDTWANQSNSTSNSKPNVALVIEDGIVCSKQFAKYLCLAQGISEIKTSIIDIYKKQN